MAREQAPAFQFYPKDFLTSERVRLMSYTERGIYITLLCSCWLEGSLPAEVGQLAALTGVPSVRFAKLWAGPLSACFYVREDGRLGQARLDKERAKQETFRRRASEGGRAALSRRGENGRFESAVSTRVAGASHQQVSTSQAPGLQSPISNLHTPVVRATHVAPPTKPADPRVSEFLKWFPEEFKKRRNGAEYLVKHAKHGALVKQMLGATDLERLKKYAAIMLKTDDEFIDGTDRGIEILSARFSWLSERLAAWEAKQRGAAS